ncbi:LacI family DNA-binding transcriptional regulator [Actinospica durhamensis]|uniref:LacI family DNA-binding transcriptional regulator n=1 Tax=Actinospica durhamensis TaxID=1508375 RepID=A0A941IUP1_9ACTN|nr:LacI family DNA-binding transcriptional regulator [Actinospica durhamensis]MBR7839397.1 LacI family DNA-binding transcriptional regulator [Actinospica durhamensis]
MNITEVARRAGVSRSTVSYALSGNRPVSDTTRARIQSVIDELGYRPNASARALANGRTRSLGLVFPPASSHYTDMQLEFIGSVAEAAAAAEHDVLLSASGDGDRALSRLVEERRVDGVIMMEIRLHDERVDYLLDAGFPFVTIGRIADPERTRWVDLDHSALTAACVRQLAGLGHRTIAFVNRSERLVRAGYESAHRGLDGFECAAQEHGVVTRAYRCDDDAAAGEALIERILAEQPRTTAIVTVNEAALGGLYRGLAKAGLSVPRDFSITGIAASRWAEAVTPQLTAADVPAHRMGLLAVDLLLELIENPDSPPRHVLLDQPVSLRASAGAAPAR